MKYFLAALMFWSALVPGARADFPDVVARLKPGVVGIGTYDPLGQPATVLVASGFAVGDGKHVMTAWHAVKSRLVQQGSSYLAGFVSDGKGDADVRRLELVASDEANDLALLRLVSGMAPTLRLDPGPAQRQGADIAFMGFPIGGVYGFYPAVHRGMVAAVTPVAIPQADMAQLDAEMIRRLSRPLRVYQLDATAYPGNSGGPVFDPLSGRVVGVMNSTFVKTTRERALGDPSGISFAVPIAPAVDMLRRAGLEP